MRKLATIVFLSSAPIVLWGQRPLVPLPHATLDPLPVPLKLPPGRTQTLPINPQASYSAETVRLVDCPKDSDNPYGDCSNFPFGGFAMFASQLSGYVQIDFDPPRRNIAHFYITHPGNLRGRPGKLKAPQLYEFPIKESVIFDAFEAVSEGDLDLTNGVVTNFNFHAFFFNTFYDALAKANPRLDVGQFSFPGAYGTAYANFEQRADGLLDIRFGATTFLPLGNQIQGDKVRMPLPLCGAEAYCNTMEAPGTSLHPGIQYSTHMDEDAAQGSCPECVNLPFNSVQMFQLNTYYSSFLDRFNLNNIGAIGGHAVSRTHFQGMLQVQFGDRTGDIVPVSLMLERPEGLIGKPDDAEIVYQTYLPLSSNKGASLGWIGHHEILTFPTGLQYFPRNVTLSSDAYDFGKGAINVKTGRFVWDLQAPGFLLHNFIMKVLEQNDGRIPIASFSMRGPALIEQGNNGQWQIRADTRTVRNYENLLFPAPDFIKAHGNIAGPGSYLDPEYRFQAALITDQPASTFTGQYDNVRAFIGDNFSIKFSIPCNPIGQPASFTYVNTNPESGGTFTMQNLGSVHCTNTKISTTGPGSYDAVSFTGFGLWSRDPDEKDPHVVTVHIFPTSPDGPYISVQVDGGVASLVHTKPIQEILP